jgi:ABC-type polysaccharide/polyol phosphate export permease
LKVGLSGWAGLPGIDQAVIATLPMYHAVALLRALTTGTVSGAQMGQAAYLLLLIATAVTVAIHRLNRAFVH